MFIGNFEILKLATKQINKKIKKEANLTTSRVKNGLEWLQQEHRKLVAKTPRVVIFRENKLKVKRYLSKGKNKPTYKTPVLLIPPLGVQPYVYDLIPGHSLVERLLKAGFNTYLVDFGEPEPSDDSTLERYITDWIPKAIESVRKNEGCNEISIFGYCMGGLFGLMYTCWAEDKDIRNLVLVGAPFDLHAFLPGPLSQIPEFLISPVEIISEKLGSVTDFPGALSKWGWKIVNPQVTLTKYFHLFNNLWNPDFMKHFSALHQWSEDFINFPIKIVPKLFEEFAAKNAFMNDSLELNGKQVKVSWLTCPLLVFAGERDIFGLPSSAKAVMKVAGSKEKEFHLVRGGHLGVIAGKSAPEDVWDIATDWLRKYSVTRGN